MNWVLGKKSLQDFRTAYTVYNKQNNTKGGRGSSFMSCGLYVAKGIKGAEKSSFPFLCVVHLASSSLPTLFSILVQAFLFLMAQVYYFSDPF